MRETLEKAKTYESQMIAWNRLTSELENQWQSWQKERDREQQKLQALQEEERRLTKRQKQLNSEKTSAAYRASQKGIDEARQIAQHLEVQPALMSQARHAIAFATTEADRYFTEMMKEIKNKPKAKE